MTNPKTLGFLAILVLLASAVLRVIKGQAGSGGAYHVIWIAGIMCIGLAFLIDLDAGLGAAASAVVLVFWVIHWVKLPVGTFTAPSPNNNQGGGTASGSGSTSGGSSGNTSGGSGSTGSTSGGAGCPANSIGVNGVCYPLNTA